MGEPTANVINESAPVFVQEQIAVKASIEEVWQAHAHLMIAALRDLAAESWPESAAGGLGPSGAGAPSPSSSTSRIVNVPAGDQGPERVQLIGTQRIGGLTKSDVYSFVSEPVGTLVTVEESWEGDGVAEQAAELTALLRISLQTRLHDLKDRAEMT